MKKLSLLLSLTAVAFYAKSQTMILAKDVAQYVGKKRFHLRFGVQRKSFR